MSPFFKSLSLHAAIIAATVAHYPLEAKTLQFPPANTPAKIQRTPDLLQTKKAKAHNSPKALKNATNCTACKEPIAICELPVTISKSGFYCLAKNVRLECNTTDAAITVEADNVDIDLSNHVITLSASTSGIFASDVNNLRVHGGTIQSAHTSANENSNAILLSGVTDATFQDLILKNTFTGVDMSNCIDVLFSNCAFAGQGYEAMRVDTGTNFQGLTIERCDFGPTLFHIGINSNGQDVTLRSCSFTGAAISFGVFEGELTNLEISNCNFFNTVYGIGLGGTTLNTQIRNCQFAQSSDAAVSLFNGQGLIIEDCTFQAASNNADALLLVAAGDPTVTVADVVVRNSTFSSPQAAPGFDTILIASAQGILIDSCIIDANPAPFIDFFPANVHIINANNATASSDIKVRSCIIRNSASYGIYCDGIQVDPTSPFAIEIDSCLIDGHTFAGVFFDSAQSCTIKNSIITGTTSGPGISVSDGSQSITILNNTIVNNAAQGIAIDAISPSNNVIDNTVTDNGGDGIFIASSGVTVKNNAVSRNGGNGINNSGALVEFYDNSACNNGIQSCVGIPAGLVVAPGGTPVAGGNLCCP
ncbi:MAG: right-handed parallel beta-helix repeat-containing protein [Verrucomicrobia bacterium]|nr:right-handed parallel beta-helix repeat-containing protein [Verrucomicrobiota bacterium]